MKAYSYDENGLLVREFDCRLDPVRSKRTGTPSYAVPAMATTVQPPEYNQETQMVLWDGNTWHVEDIPPAPEPGPEPDPQPSALDIIEAQVMYTAIKTGTLLEV